MVDLQKAKISNMFSKSTVAKVSSLHASEHKGYFSYPQRKTELQRIQIGKSPLIVVAIEVFPALTYPQLHY